jgi:hypothetical protein
METWTEKTAISNVKKQKKSTEAAPPLSRMCGVWELVETLEDSGCSLVGGHGEGWTETWDSDDCQEHPPENSFYRRFFKMTML